MLTGEQAEKKFLDAMSKRSQNVRHVTKEENMYGHFDLVCDGVKYDVKAHKQMNRWDNKVSDVVWLELRNVRGNRGWLKGDADKIAFQQEDKFLIVDRLKLYEWLKTQVTDLNIYSSKEYKKLYQRTNRKDIITYIYYSDLTPLIETTIKID